MKTGNDWITHGQAWVNQEGDKPRPVPPEYVIKNGILVPKDLEPKRTQMGFIQDNK
jgi:hypothetical protein